MRICVFVSLVVVVAAAVAHASCLYITDVLYRRFFHRAQDIFVRLWSDAASREVCVRVCVCACVRVLMLR